MKKLLFLYLFIFINCLNAAITPEVVYELNSLQQQITTLHTQITKLREEVKLQIQHNEILLTNFEMLDKHQDVLVKLFQKFKDRNTFEMKTLTNEIKLLKEQLASGKASDSEVQAVMG